MTESQKADLAIHVLLSRNADKKSKRIANQIIQQLLTREAEGSARGE